MGLSAAAKQAFLKSTTEKQVSPWICKPSKQYLNREERMCEQAAAPTLHISSNKHAGHYFCVYAPSKHLPIKNSKSFRCSAENNCACKLMLAPSLFSDQIKNKTKQKPKQNKQKMPWELYRAKSEEFQVTSSWAIRRAWNSPELGNSKNRASLTPRQSHSRHYAASSGELTSQLPNTEHNWTGLTHMGISAGKQWSKNKAKISY